MVPFQHSFVILCSTHGSLQQFLGPGQFPGIAGNHGNDRKFHESHQILNQIQKNNKLCLTKISHQKAVRIKFSVDSLFSKMFYGKKRKPRNARNQQKAF